MSFEMWTEKYRPKSLDEMINQTQIVERLKSFVKSRNVPHCIFAGPPGTGKTTAALCLAHDLYGKAYREYLMELNASDERGINVIRETVKTFARSRAMGEIPFKILILDEADNMTADAQQALRRTMESYSETCRFILDCNYSSKIIEPIQSRCVIFRFKPLSEKDVEKYLERIAKSEKLEIDKGAIKAIFKECSGDLRKATNILQACASINKKITEDIVLQVIGKAKTKDVEELLKLSLDGKFLKAREKLLDLMINQGVNAEDLLKQIYSTIYELDIKDEDKIRIIKLLGEYEFRVVEGSNPLIQIEAFLANLKN